jgi:HSP20 family protein
MAEVKEMAKPKTNGAQAPTKAATTRARRDLQRAERSARRASTRAMRARSPFAFISRFAEEMDRLIEDFGMEAGPFLPWLRGGSRWLAIPPEDLAQTAWAPRVEILDRDGKFVVRAELPGLSKDDIQVDVTDEAIVIRGERKHESKVDREGYTYSERSYGSFYRAIPLPEDADASRATAEFRNGVLEVAIPTPARAEKARRIEVREGK